MTGVQTCALPICELLADVRSVLPNQAPKALISPHAGYIYSGSTAAHGYAALHPETQPISRVVVACPTHRVGIQGIALTTGLREPTSYSSVR